MKENITYEIDPERVRPTELRTFIGKFDKFEKLTKWEPEISLQETLQAILDYWREFIDEKWY